VDGLRLNPATSGQALRAGGRQRRQGQEDPHPHRLKRRARSRRISSRSKRSQRPGHGRIRTPPISDLEDCAIPRMKVSLKALDPAIDASTPTALLADQVDYSLPPGGDRAGTPGVRHDQSPRSGLGAPPVRKDRRYHPRLALRRTDRRGTVGIDILKASASQGRAQRSCRAPRGGRADSRLVKAGERRSKTSSGGSRGNSHRVRDVRSTGPGEARAADIGVAGGRGIGFDLQKR